MRVNLTQWHRLKEGDAAIVSSDVHVKLVKPGAVYADGVLVAYGTDIRFKALNERVVSLLCDEDAFYYSPVPTVVEMDEDVPTFTNEDKRPIMSPAEQAVTLGLRQMRRMQREIERERARRREESEVNEENEEEIETETEDQQEAETEETSQEV